MGAEANLAELDALPKFLHAIFRTPMLEGDLPEFSLMVCIGHPFLVRPVCPFRPDVSIFDTGDPSSVTFCPIN
jgi:hypothetical protein